MCPNSSPRDWFKIGIFRTKKSPDVMESGFRNQGNFCLGNPESWSLDSGIQLKEPIGIPNPSFTDKESESRAALDSLTWGEKTRDVLYRGRDCMKFGTLKPTMHKENFDRNFSRLLLLNS